MAGSAPARPQPRVRGGVRGLNDHPAPRGGGGVYSHVLTSRGPYGRFEHLLTDGAVEIIFGVGRGRGELLSHGGRWGNRGYGGGSGPGGGVGPGPDSLREPGGGGESRQEAARARKEAGPDRARRDEAERDRRPRSYGRTRRARVDPRAAALAGAGGRGGAGREAAAESPAIGLTDVSTSAREGRPRPRPLPYLAARGSCDSAVFCASGVLFRGLSAPFPHPLPEPPTRAAGFRPQPTLFRCSPPRPYTPLA